MRKTLLILLTLAGATGARAQVGLGADVVSRYVWRGTDFGDAVSVQPYLSYAAGPLAVGTWASYPIAAAAGANEHDLYATWSVRGLSLTLTDYYFPQGARFLEFGDGDGAHHLEASAAYGAGPFSMMAGVFFWNDDDHSIYAEAGYALPELADGVEAGLVAAVGTGQFSSDADPKLVVLGLRAARERYSVTYVLNPDAEVSHLVLGVSF